EPEQRRTGGQQPPGGARPGLVAADAGEDRDDRRQADQVHQRAAALQRGQEQVRRARERAHHEVGGPERCATDQGHAVAALRALALRSSPRSTRSSTAAISRSTSASVLADVTWTRKPTSSSGTSG